MSGRLEVVPKFLFPSSAVNIKDSGSLESRDLKKSFVLGVNTLGEHHKFATGTDSNGEKGFDRGTLTGDATVSGDKLTLSTDNTTGTWTVSLPYNPIGANSNAWETLTYSTNEPSNTSVTVNILDAAGNTLASDVSSGTDLSTISGTQSTDIQLEVDLESTSTSGNKPELTEIIANFTGAQLGDQSGSWNTKQTW